MKILFDGSLCQQGTTLAGTNDRGLHYGDGLFETMLMTDKGIRHADLHAARIQEGASLLGMDASDLRPEIIQKKAKYLREENGLEGTLRVKWSVWRQTGGLYTPTSTSLHEMVQISPCTPGPAEVKKADFAERIFLSYSAISPYKTMSALPYVVASIECREKGMDDLVLLSARGHVAECLYANIFWGSGKNLYTPSLQTGCIGGVRRKALLEALPDYGYTITECESSPEELLKAAYAFRTNATSIAPIRRIADRSYLAVPEDIVNLDEI